ncbi:ATP-binding protein [Streptomyces cynarae]|uniref:ATP-binding protein n=1 Tax=Streptomyces cynarae TaxID=2981134 RepID=A0ABY6EBN1_9ACTN|nr:ATP-binding protein [Streptomyces cynarae]
MDGAEPEAGRGRRFRRCRRGSAGSTGAAGVVGSAGAGRTALRLRLKQRQVLATAILDRLLDHCEVVPIKGPGYRLKNGLTAVEGEAASPEICRAVSDRAKCRLLGAVCPGTRSTRFRSVSGVPVAHEAAMPGRPRGHASVGHGPSSRSRPGSRNTMRTRCTARTWRTPADRSGTGMSGRASHRPRIFADPHRGPSPRSPP